MKRTTRLARLLGLALALAAAAAPIAQATPNPDVPDDIAVEDGHKPYLVSHATGVQIYSCNGQAWTFVAPRADLYDKHGRKLIGSHFAGPTWQAKDGSKVVGARVAGVKVDPTAIDWLLLSATSSEGPRGGDDFAQTTFIQRIDTTGGLAPSAASCNAATAGTTAEVPYTADYVFWKAQRRRCDRD